jgi:hypothetical protein
MHINYYLLLLLTVSFFYCNKKAKSSTNYSGKTKKEAKYISNIDLPEGYSRVKSSDSSFGNFLQKQLLKTDKTVYLYNGEKKRNQDAQYAVIDISVGDKDLQQCADAVMRLRAEYFFKYKKYDSIVFYDNEKTKYAFNSPYTRANFDKYLLKVFGMCGTKSLEMQLKQKSNLNDIQIGDVWIKGGFPGHAVIVVDVATNEEGEKIFMIAQSYMPAQNMHILKNDENDELSPWFKISEITNNFITPEYTFTNNQLRSW